MVRTARARTWYCTCLVQLRRWQPGLVILVHAFVHHLTHRPIKQVPLQLLVGTVGDRPPVLEQLECRDEVIPVLTREAHASMGKDTRACASANALQQKAICTTKAAKMLRQASVDHLVGIRRQVGASRQHVLIEASEALELCIWDADRDHLAIAIAAQAIHADGKQDVGDMERRDAQAPPVPRCNTQEVQVDVLQRAGAPFGPRSICHFSDGR